MNLDYQAKRYASWDIKIQTAKYLGQLFVAFTAGDDMIVFSTLVLVQPSPPCIRWPQYFLGGPSRKPWPFLGYSGDTRLVSVAHAHPCFISIRGFGHNKSLGHFSLSFFHLQLQSFKQWCAWRKEEDVAVQPIRKRIVMGSGSGGRSQMKEGFWDYDWSPSSSFPGCKRANFQGREPYSVTQFKCPP